VFDRRGLDLRDTAAASTEAHHVASSLALLQRGLGGRVAGGRVVVADERGIEVLALWYSMGRTTERAPNRR
jgi:hypothetical protein